MAEKITALQILDRVRNQLSTTWKESPSDVINMGSLDTIVTGITTSFTPSLYVLKQSVAAGKNLIITQQPAFYQDNLTLDNDPTYLLKKAYIEKNNLVLWRFYDNWNARTEDGQLLGLAKALGWDKYHLHNASLGEPKYNKNEKFFLLPETTLSKMVANMEGKLQIKGIRVIGDPNTKIKKAALSHGMLQFSELQEILKDPAVDLVVVAEAIEWESPEYFRDLLTWGKKKCMIILGREASEDPGYGEVALWLKTFITEVPIDWISAREPFWVP